jgi:predicted nuclease of predicted toxin-antitoxin system
MKFKLDENFGQRTQDIFKKAGHDIHTVREEGLAGASDNSIYTICRQEQRCLITLDLDFADVIHFPPQTTGGIIVIRTPRNQNLSTLESLIRQFLQALKQDHVEGQLWIIEPNRIRIHQISEEE